MAHINENELKSLMIDTKKLHATQSVGTLKVGAEGMLMKVPAVYDLAQKEAVTKISRDLTNNQYRARLARKPVLDRMTSYFSDEDGDGVINLQDCYPGDKSKHGFFSGIQSIYNKTVAAVGSQEMASAAMEREANRKHMEEQVQIARKKIETERAAEEAKIKRDEEQRIEEINKQNRATEQTLQGDEKPVTIVANRVGEVVRETLLSPAKVAAKIIKKRFGEAKQDIKEQYAIEQQDATFLKDVVGTNVDNIKETIKESKPYEKIKQFYEQKSENIYGKAEKAQAERIQREAFSGIEQEMKEKIKAQEKEQRQQEKEQRQQEKEKREQEKTHKMYEEAQKAEQKRAEKEANQTYQEQRENIRKEQRAKINPIREGIKSNIGSYLKEKFITGGITDKEGKLYTFGSEGNAPSLTREEEARKFSILGRVKERWTPEYLKSPEQRAKEKQTATLNKEILQGTYIYPEIQKAKEKISVESTKFDQQINAVKKARQKELQSAEMQARAAAEAEILKGRTVNPHGKKDEIRTEQYTELQKKKLREEMIKEYQEPILNRQKDQIDTILQAKQERISFLEANKPTKSTTYAAPTFGTQAATKKELQAEELHKFQILDMQRKSKLSELNLINEELAIKQAKERAKGFRSSFMGGIDLSRNMPYVQAPQTRFVAPTYYGAPRPTAAPIFMEYTPSRGRPTEVAQEFGFTSGFGINQIPMPSAGPTQGIGTPQDLGNFFIQPKQAPIQRPQMPKGANMFPNGTTPKPRVYPKRGEFKGGKVRGFGSLSKVGKKARPTYNRQATAGLTSTGADFTKLKKLPQQKQSSTEYRQQRQYRDYHLVKMYGDRGKQIVEERGRSLTPIKHRKPKMY